MWLDCDWGGHLYSPSVVFESKGWLSNTMNHYLQNTEVVTLLSTTVEENR